MEVFRLSREQFADDLSGKGAAIKGARWNSVGVELLYTASNRSLAMAEVAVHLTLAMVPDDYMLITIFIPDDIPLQRLTPADLTPDWNLFPYTMATQAVGDQFARDNKFCVLQIPSVVTKGDFNFLVNPKHPDAVRVKIINKERFPFDKRIFTN